VALKQGEGLPAAVRAVLVDWSLLGLGILLVYHIVVSRFANPTRCVLPATERLCSRL
jgi:hypothetical protein